MFIFNNAHHVEVVSAIGQSIGGGDGEDIDLFAVDYKEIQKFIVRESRNKKTGALKSHSTPEGYRNALLYHYKVNNKPFPAKIAADLMTFLKGYRNQIATDISEGNYKGTEGKQHISWETL